MTKGNVIFVERDDGSVSLSYTDYNVEMFGGDDYEVNYVIDSENVFKLREYLAQNNSGTLEEMIINEFGIHLDKKSFAAVCKEQGVEYKLNTWIG